VVQCYLPPSLMSMSWDDQVICWKTWGNISIFYVYFCSVFLDLPGIRFPDLGFSVVWTKPVRCDSLFVDQQVKSSNSR
jgi:hypothetical protein